MTEATNPLDDVTSTAPATVRPAKPKKAPTATELAIKEVNGIVGSFDTVAAGLAELSTKYKDVVYAVATTKGMEEAKAARMEVREARFKVQRALDAAKSPLNTLKADITARANEIIAQITPLEDPIDEQIKAQEKIKADERAERERLEAEAKARIDAQIDAIRGFIVNCTGMSSADIEDARTGVEAIIVDLETFGDRTGEAEQVKARVLESLSSMRDNAAALEMERADLARKQEELRKERDAEEARIAAERAAEARRLAEERAANEKAAKELADQRAAFQKEQDEARAVRQAAEDAERARKQKAEDEARAAERAAQEAQDAIERNARAAKEAEEATERFNKEAAETETRQKAEREATEQRTRELQEEHEASLAAIKMRDAAPTMLTALQAAHHMLTRDGIDDAKMIVVKLVSEAIELATGAAPF